MSKEPTPQSDFSNLRRDQPHVAVEPKESEKDKEARELREKRTALSTALTALSGPAPNDAISEANRVAAACIAEMIDKLTPVEKPK